MTTTSKLFITTLIVAILGIHQLGSRIINNADLEEFLDDLTNDLGLKIINVQIYQDYVAIEAICPNQLDWQLQIPKWFIFSLPNENHQEPVDDRMIIETPIEQEVAECPICFEKYDTKEKVDLITPCNHKFCLTCSKKIFEEKKQGCPVCRKEVSGQEFQKMLSDSQSKL